MKEAPFQEILVPKDSADPGAVDARRHLHEVMARLVGSNAAPARAEAPSKAKGQRAGKKAKRTR